MRLGDRVCPRRGVTDALALARSRSLVEDELRDGCATAQRVPVQVADPAVTVTMSPAALSGAYR
jgi:hypothetical protein